MILALGFLLLATHILSCISVGFVFRFWKSKKFKDENSSHNIINKNISLKSNTPNKSFKSLGELLSDSIQSSINTLFLIGGFVVLFSVIISICKQSHLLDYFSNCLQPFFNLFGINSSFINPFVSGLIELTNGLKNISLINTKTLSISISLCAFLLGFGGICVALQVFSITSKTDISIKPYLLGKLLHGTLAAIYTYVAMKFIPIFNLDLAFVFSNNSTPIIGGFNSNYIIIIIVLITFFMLYKFFKNIYILKRS